MLLNPVYTGQPYTLVNHLHKSILYTGQLSTQVNPIYWSILILLNPVYTGQPYTDYTPPYQVNHPEDWSTTSHNHAVVLPPIHQPVISPVQAAKSATSVWWYVV